MLAVLGDTVAVFAKVVVAPRRAIAADDVDLVVGMTQLYQQIVEQIEFLDVVILHVIGAMVAQEVVEFRNLLGNILIADAIDDIDALAGVKVVEAQAVLLGCRRYTRIIRSDCRRQSQH